MSKFRFIIRISLRFFAALVGLGLLGYLVFRTGPGVVWKQLQAVGWGLALIIILGGFSQFIKTCAWRQAFRGDISRFSWPRSFVAQLISDGRAIWCCWKGAWGGDPHIAVAFYSPGI